jgi:hypothetical protein
VPPATSAYSLYVPHLKSAGISVAFLWPLF